MNDRHSKNIVHRDLKPENILFLKPGPDSPIRICDFGYATYIENDIIEGEWCGTPEFQAPELVNFESYGKPVDVWALGVISFVLLTGKLPFDSLNTMKLFSMIRECQYEWPEEVKNSFSRESVDFTNSCLQLNAKERPLAQAAQRHKWFGVQQEKIAENTLRNFSQNVFELNQKREERFQEMKRLSTGTAELRKSLLTIDLTTESSSETESSKSPSEMPMKRNLKKADQALARQFKNFPGSLVVPNRFLIFDQELGKQNPHRPEEFQKRHVHLFNDILVYSKKTSIFSTHSYQVKGVVPLQTCVVSKFVNYSKKTAVNETGFELILSHTHRKYTFLTKSKDFAEKWISLLQKCIEVFRMRPKAANIGGSFVGEGISASAAKRMTRKIGSPASSFNDELIEEKYYEEARKKAGPAPCNPPVKPDDPTNVAAYKTYMKDKYEYEAWENSVLHFAQKLKRGENF